MLLLDSFSNGWTNCASQVKRDKNYFCLTFLGILSMCTKLLAVCGQSMQCGCSKNLEPPMSVLSLLEIEVKMKLKLRHHLDWHGVNCCKSFEQIFSSTHVFHVERRLQTRLKRGERGRLKERRLHHVSKSHRHAFNRFGLQQNIHQYLLHAESFIRRLPKTKTLTNQIHLSTRQKLDWSSLSPG